MSRDPSSGGASVPSSSSSLSPSAPPSFFSFLPLCTGNTNHQGAPMHKGEGYVAEVAVASIGADAHAVASQAYGGGLPSTPSSSTMMQPNH